MATFKQVIIFHLLLFVINIDRVLPLEVDHAFGVQGGEVTFEVMNTYRLSDGNFTCLLYRSTKDGDHVLLINSSNQSEKPASRLGVKFYRYGYAFCYFSVTNLSMADKGRYITERWRNGVLRESRAHDLTVCETIFDLTTHTADDYVLWIMKNIRVKEGDRLLGYRQDDVKYYEDNPVKKMIVNTSLAMSGVLDGDVKVFSSNSTIIWNTTMELSNHYHFLIWSEDGCSAYGKREVPPWALSEAEVRGSFVVKTGESIALPCPLEIQYKEVFTWKTPLKDIYVDRFLPANLTQNKETMYVEPSNDSLIITSISANHSGIYTCGGYEHEVSVCTDLEALHLTFSAGGNVVLDWVAGIKVTEGRCSSKLHKAMELVNHTAEAKKTGGQNKENMLWASMDKDPRIRFSCSNFPRFSLTITNLTTTVMTVDCIVGM